ncbi:MAG: uracil-DNA glycosylase [Polyangiaceae bacterium]
MSEPQPEAGSTASPQAAATLESELDPAAELQELTRLLRVHLEWQLETGAVGLEPADDALRSERPSALGEPLERQSSQADATHAHAPAQRIPEAKPAGPPPGPAPTQAAPAERVRAAEPPLPSPPSHGSPPPPSAAWERDRGSAQAPAARAPLPPRELPNFDERQAALQTLAQRISPCRDCRLCEQRTQTVFARGTGRSGVCFVGEGPGVDEDRVGEPFVGKAGQLLDKMIAAMGIERDDVYVCNVVKCRPPNNRKPAPDEMLACRDYLAEQLDLVSPRVIVALGATAVEGLLGSTGGITRIRGRWRLYKGRVPVMPTFHPAYLLRNPRAKREVWDDLKSVMAHLKNPPGSSPQS